MAKLNQPRPDHALPAQTVILLHVGWGLKHSAEILADNYDVFDVYASVTIEIRF